MIKEKSFQIIKKSKSNIFKTSEYYRVCPFCSSEFMGGTYIHLEDLAAKGFDFSVFAGRARLFNIDQQYNCHYLQSGEYRLYLVEYSTLLIANTKTK